MATLGHIAVGLSVARAACPAEVSTTTRRRAMLALACLSWAPDLDVLAFGFGIPYEAPWGHRGAAHSLAMAVLVGVVAALVAGPLGWSRLRVGLAVGLTVASHGLLDIFTDGGLGMALFWPFSDVRVFAPWRPLPVAPIGPAIFSPHGLGVLAFEALWFAPLFLYALWPRRRARRPDLAG